MAARLLLVAALTAVPVLSQAPADPSTGCSSRSFSIPSWIIQDVKFADAKISFNILNRVTNGTASLACQTKGNGWNACTVDGTAEPKLSLESSVQVSEKSLTFQVNETWSCNDRGKAITITAAGSSTVALDYKSPILVKGSLLSPVAITPAYADGPTGHDSTGCTSKSEKPLWRLSTIHFIDQTGDGVTTMPYKNFNLVLDNTANGYQASCMIGAGFSYNNSDLAHLVCAGDEFQSFRVGRYPVSTQASFQESTSTFLVNQTWFCDDTDAAKPLQINAAGSVALPLTCTTSKVDGETHKYCTTEDPVSLPGTLGPVLTLPPYSLEDPVPARDGCTLTSIFNPSWLFSDFRIHDANSSSSSISFEIILSAPDRGFQYPIEIYQGEAVEGKKGWYQCDIGPDGGNGLPLWPYECSFAYEAGTQELTLNAKWDCRDLDEKHPIHFSGVTTTAINSTLSCEAVDGLTQCATADLGYSWVAAISNVTWK